MCASANGATTLDSFAAQWGPKLVRFYFFVCADNALAESSAIETLISVSRSGRTRLDPFALARFAVTKSAALPCGDPKSDKIARAFLSLSISKRLALALVRGLGLSVAETAEAMSIKLEDAQRLVADGLLDLHRILTTGPVGTLEKPRET